MRCVPDGMGGFVLVEDADLSSGMPVLLDHAERALDANAAFLTLRNPTQGQSVAQVQSLTRQVNALVRLRVGAFDSTGGTAPGPSALDSRRTVVADRVRPFLPWVPGVVAFVLSVLGLLGVV